jgi:hypothetical protein
VVSRVHGRCAGHLETLFEEAVRAAEFAEGVVAVS